MPESKHELIADGIRQLLASIESDHGVNFWYEPDAVLRVTFFEDSWLDSSIGRGYLIFIRPGEEIHTEETAGEIRAEMEIFLLIARKNGRATENPFTESSPTRWLELNRAVRDILKKLWSWSSSSYFSGTGIENISADGILIDRTQEAGGWVLGQIRLRPVYSYAKEDP